MRLLLWDHYHAGMGGIEKLIITLGKELGHTHDIVVISRKGSIIHEKLSELNPRFMHVDSSAPDFQRNFRRDDLLIDFGGYTEMQRLARVNPRVLMWRVFPEIGCMGRWDALIARRILMRLEKKNALFFMDPNCHEATCLELNYVFEQRLLPLPIIDREKGYIVKNNHKPINITYIGRGTRPWKVKPVKKLVADLRQITQEEFHLHIFTDDNTLFEDELKDIKGGNVKVDYLFGYTMDALSNKLLALSDIHYSMATAALEGGILGIPTIIADASHSDFPDNYRYRWLMNDIENYAGGFIEQMLPPGQMLKEIIAEVRTPEKLKQISEKTHSLVRRHFSSRRLVEKIADMDPAARITDIVRFMPSYWLTGGPFQINPERFNRGQAN